MAAITVREEIVSANQHFMKLFGEGDATAISSLYTSNGQVLPPQSEPIGGRPNIEAFWRAGMGMGIANVKIETIEVSEHGEVAYEVGSYALSTAGGESVDHGKYVVIWRKERGEWKLHRDIWNTSVNPKV